MRKPFREFFAFPNPVNETAARVVAGGVVLISLLYMTLAWQPLLFLLAYGFLARVLAGPKISPLGLIATKIIAPRLPVSYCPGPPKRFAQGIGLLFSSTAILLSLLGLEGWAMIVIGLLLLAATLESAFGFCLGCKIFSLFMKWGIVPEEVCEKCQNIWNQPRTSADLSSAQQQKQEIDQLR